MKKDQRIIQSEKAIIEAGIHTFLENPTAGMSDIATAAGVGRATLYRHFESREALIQRLAVVCLQEIDTAMEPYHHLKGRAALEIIIDVVLPIADRFRFLTHLWHVIIDDEVVKRISDQQFKDMCMLVDEAKEMGDIDDLLPTAWVVGLFDSMLGVAWMMIESGDVSVDQAAIYTKKSFFSGCAKPIKR